MAFLLCAAPARAEDGVLTLPIGEGELLRLARPAVSVFVANPEVADVQVPSPNSLFVLGKKAGTTTLYALDANDHVLLKRQVAVRHNTDELQSLLRQRFPQYRLSVASAPGSLMVSGNVENAADINAIGNTLTPFLTKDEKLINSVQITTPTQVHLRVRIAELSREVDQEFGVNWSSLMSPGHLIGGLYNGRSYIDSDTGAFVLSDSAWSTRLGFSTNNFNIDAVIDALDGEGLISIMAEPNLTAVSGQTASFLAGGEFPIPIDSDDDGVTIQFKPFGVSLAFTPTVLAPDRISLLVRPEVSQLNTTNGITLNGISIPGLDVRRVETTVELASGQSFAIGGLLQDNMSDEVSRLPGLGNLPVLGKLFSSQSYLSKKSELVVIVTAYVVRPTDSRNLRSPLQTLRPAGDIEFIAQNRLGIDPLAADSPRLIGSAGFVY